MDKADKSGPINVFAIINWKNKVLMAIKEHNTVKLRHLFREVPKGASAILWFYNPWHKAVLFNNIYNIKRLELLDRHERVNKRSDLDKTPLHLACMMNNFGIVRFLLSCGANPNIYDERMLGPLDAAIDVQNCDIVYVLLQYGAHINKFDRLGFTPALHAIRMKDLAALKILCDYGANLWVREGKTSNTVFHYAHYNFNILNYVLGIFIAAGDFDTINVVNSCGRTPLMDAFSTYSDISCIVLMLNAGCDVNFAFEGKTVLHEALQKGNRIPLCELLFSHISVSRLMNVKANMDLLHLAVLNKRLDILNMLIQKQYPLDTEVSIGYLNRNYMCKLPTWPSVLFDLPKNVTPLGLAVVLQDKKASQLLAHAGASVNSVSKKCAQPLLLALTYHTDDDDDELVKNLLKWGSNIKNKTQVNFMRLILCLAVIEQSWKHVECVLDAGIDLFIDRIHFWQRFVFKFNFYFSEVADYTYCLKTLIKLLIKYMTMTEWKRLCTYTEKKYLPNIEDINNDEEFVMTIHKSLSLKHMCRVNIRKSLIAGNPSLLCIDLNRLHLPTTLEDYVVHCNC